MLSTSVARDIVRKISRNLDYNINLMDNNATIIASTDEKRIGEYHQGASFVIDNKDIVEINPRTMLNNVREGINLPIELNGYIAGVIGITGKIEEVRKYGLIIKEMTEILLMNSLYVEDTILEMKRKYMIVEDLLNIKQTIVLSESEKERINRVFEASYCTIILKLKVDVSSPNQITIYYYLKQYFPDDQLISSISEQQIILIANEKIYKLLLNALKNMPGIECYNVGVGHVVNNKDEIRESFKLAMFLSNQPGEFYSPQNISDQYLIETSDNTATKLLINKVFNQLDSQEIDNIIELVNMYVKYNGRINELSEALYIHKNTLQYRLNKIHKRTGYNPRSLEDIYYLVLAGKLYRNQRKS